MDHLPYSNVSHWSEITVLKQHQHFSGATLTCPQCQPEGTLVMHSKTLEAFTQLVDRLFHVSPSQLKWMLPLKQRGGTLRIKFYGGKRSTVATPEERRKKK